VNFLGIEYARQYWRHAADRLRRHGLTHVRMLYADAGEFVRWHVPDTCIRQVHIYFPDPWPKKRHHKRRLIQSPLLIELHRILVEGGFVRIVTDHDDYFAWIEAAAEAVSDRVERLPFERPISADADEVVGTNFERKYRHEGRPFHAMTLAKR
jgi:tRNA (guanine-N7-)-methyltransferase